MNSTAIAVVVEDFARTQSVGGTSDSVVNIFFCECINFMFLGIDSQDFQGSQECQGKD